MKEIDDFLDAAEALRRAWTKDYPASVQIWLFNEVECFFAKFGGEFTSRDLKKLKRSLEHDFASESYAARGRKHEPLKARGFV